MAVAEKVCRDCGKSLPLTDVYVKRAATGERQSYCKLCADVRATAWQKDNKDRVNALGRERRVKFPEQAARYDLRRAARRLGLDPDEIEAHFLAHNGLCDSCGRGPEESVQPKKRLSIDHDHKTGKFRGLLCADCNLIIGLAHENVKQLLGAVAYLERS